MILDNISNPDYGSASRKRKSKREISPEIYNSARAYVDKQLALMKKYGAVRDLSPERYEKLIQDIARVVESASVSG